MELYNCQNYERDTLIVQTDSAFSMSQVLKDLTMQMLTLSDLLSQTFAQN